MAARRKLLSKHVLWQGTRMQQQNTAGSSVFSATHAEAI
jgi:hypothetical protein